MIMNSITPLNTAGDKIALSGNGELEFNGVSKRRLNKALFKGKTSKYNQQVENGNFESASGWSGGNVNSRIASNNTLIVTVYNPGSFDIDKHRTHRQFDAKFTHKYYIHISAYFDYDIETLRFGITTGYSDGRFTMNNVSGGIWHNISTVLTPQTETSNYFIIAPLLNSDYDDYGQYKLKDAICVDLTNDFGAGNEPATAEQAKNAYAQMGIHIDKWQGYYPNGILLSNDSKWECSGHNIWDEEWEIGGINAYGTKVAWDDRIRSKNYIKVEPNAQYFLQNGSGGYLRIHQYDSNYLQTSYELKNNEIFITDSECKYILFDVQITSYNHNICINVPDSSFNGQYEPYHNGGTVDLSSIKLNGIGDVQDTFDSQTGKLDRKLGVVDLGSLIWNAYSNNRFSGRLPIEGKHYTVEATPNIICPKYMAIRSDKLTDTDKSTCISTPWQGAAGIAIWIRDTDYSDASAFKTAMNGVYAVYEIETPTNETITPLPLTQLKHYNLIRQTDGTIADTSLDIEYYGLNGSMMLPNGIGCVNLGELNWIYSANYGYMAANVNNITDMPMGYDGIEGLCVKYKVNTNAIYSSALPNMEAKVSWNRWSATKQIVVHDSAYTDPTVFKQAMKGVLLFYKKATT